MTKAAVAERGAIVACPRDGCGRTQARLVGFTLPHTPTDPEYSRYECVCGHEWTVKEGPIDEPHQR